jgi:hypothetical protein
VPAKPADAAKTTLFPEAVSNAFAFTTTYVVHDTLRNGLGYWLKFPGAENMNVSGDPVLADTIDLQVGWNLIGTLATALPAGAAVQSPPGIVTSVTDTSTTAWRLAWPMNTGWRHRPSATILAPAQRNAGRPDADDLPQSITIRTGSARLSVRHRPHLVSPVRTPPPRVGSTCASARGWSAREPWTMRRRQYPSHRMEHHPAPTVSSATECLSLWAAGPDGRRRPGSVPAHAAGNARFR